MKAEGAEEILLLLAVMVRGGCVKDGNLRQSNRRVWLVNTPWVAGGDRGSRNTEEGGSGWQGMKLKEGEEKCPGEVMKVCSTFHMD